jgi:protein-tyrosine phosphatase
MKPSAILFICMGNICRSPTAEGVLRQRAEQAGLKLLIDSAATHAYHTGEAPDPRTQAHAARRGVDLSMLRARPVTAQDFATFDYLLAMDHDNLAQLEARCPQEHRHKLGLLMRYASKFDATAVPDPYYGEAADFERVLDYVEAAAAGLIAHLNASPAL